MIRRIRYFFIAIVFTFCILFAILIKSNYLKNGSNIGIIPFLGDQWSYSIKKKQYNIRGFSDGHNSTHLWSMRLADEDYFRRARLLPCRNVSYGDDPRAKVDACDQSPNNEFSIANLIQGQKWLYEHQHPSNCSDKRFAIIYRFASSGFGSSLHQIAWAFGSAIAEDRIAVYELPGTWFYGACSEGTPDCHFLPITNCSIPTPIDGNRVIRINADFGHWDKPIHPPIFQNRTFNWYRAQLAFYLMRFTPELLGIVQNTIARNFIPPSLDAHRPYIAVYVRRSDKVKGREMSQAYSLKQYFDLFDEDARRTNITNVYINSEDAQVFQEFEVLNKEKQGYYKLLSISVSRNVIYEALTGMSTEQRHKITLEFLSDLYIEVNADLHAGTLTSNWCRLVDEIRLVLGKTLMFYTPENRFLLNY